MSRIHNLKDVDPKILEAIRKSAESMTEEQVEESYKRICERAAESRKRMDDAYVVSPEVIRRPFDI